MIGDVVEIEMLYNILFRRRKEKKTNERQIDLNDNL
jgi:hypothetical protein